MVVSTPGMGRHLFAGMDGAVFARVRFARQGGPGFHALMNSRSGGAFITHWASSKDPALSPAQAATAASSSSAATADKDDGAVWDASAVSTLPALLAQRKASEEAGTCFESSADGSMLAVGTSEGSAMVGVCAVCGCRSGCCFGCILIYAGQRISSQGFQITLHLLTRI